MHLSPEERYFRKTGPTQPQFSTRREFILEMVPRESFNVCVPFEEGMGSAYQLPTAAAATCDRGCVTRERKVARRGCLISSASLPLPLLLPSVRVHKGKMDRRRALLSLILHYLRKQVAHLSREVQSCSLRKPLTSGFFPGSGRSYC